MLTSHDHEAPILIWRSERSQHWQRKVRGNEEHRSQSEHLKMVEFTTRRSDVGVQIELESKRLASVSHQKGSQTHLIIQLETTHHRDQD